jgi:hypothetical protein
LKPSLGQYSGLRNNTKANSAGTVAYGEYIWQQTTITLTNVNGMMDYGKGIMVTSNFCTKLILIWVGFHTVCLQNIA